MKKEQNTYIRLMDSFLQFIKKLPQEDILKIEDGSASIQFELIEKTVILKKEKLVSKEIIADDVITYLNQLNDRAKAMEYLESLEIPRKSLEEILRKLDHPFTKKDNVDKLKEKIIESTIGFRLRSMAIQGNSESLND